MQQELASGQDWYGFGASVAIDGDTAIIGYGVYTTSAPFGIQGTAQIYRIAAPAPLEAWREHFFGTTENAGDAADNADPNCNGLVNLLDYAFGLDPLGSQTTGRLSVDQTGLLSQRGVPTVMVDGPPMFTYLHRKDIAETGLTYTVQFSSDLRDWFDSDGAIAQIVGSDIEMEALRVPFPAMLSNSGPAVFGRVGVEITPSS